jgi:hypothetical protein
MIKRCVACLCIVLASACSYPVTRTTIPDERPTLSLTGVPAGAVLFIDAASIGPADQFLAGVSAVRLEPGTHVVQLRTAGAVIYEQRVYLTGGVYKVLDVNLARP